MNNNPNNYKFDPNTGEPILNNQPNIGTPNNDVFNQNNYVQPQQVPVQPVEPVQPAVQPVQPKPEYVSENTGYIPPIGPNTPVGYVPPVQPQNKPTYEINNPQKKSKSKGGLVFFYIFILAIIGACVAAILLPKKTAVKKDLTRTVMIYMVGSDLESKAGFGTQELNAIKYNNIDNENVKVVLIAGGSEYWFNNYIDEDETSIFELKEDGFEKVKEQDVKNMASSKVFSDYLEYVYENYKSDRYDLIFWDHGGAIQGSEYDQLYDNDVLSLEEIEEGLKDSPFNKDNKLEVVIFSTCLNGTIEVANIFKDYAEYLVASEEATLSVQGGSDFKFIHDIEKTDKAYDVAYKFVDGYKNKLNRFYNQAGYVQSKSYSTYSIIDLQNVGELVDAVNDFFADIDIDDNYNMIARVRSNIYQYPAESIYYDMVDLYNLVDGLKELSPSKAQKVLDIFDKTVSYNWATNSKSRGLSIYFPYKSHQTYVVYFKNIYNKFSDFSDYASFINRFDTMHSSGKSSSKSYKNNVAKVDYENGKGDFTLELTDEQAETFASAKYLVFMDNKDGTYKPFYLNGNAYLDGKTLNAKIRGKQLKVTFDPDENGQTSYPLILNELDADENYIRYRTTVILEDFTDEKLTMDNAYITLIYDIKNDSIDIADVQLYSKDDDLPERVSVDINNYSKILFSGSSSYYIDDDSNFTSNGVITGYEVAIDEFGFELEDFDDGDDYYCMFIIEDTYGNQSYTKLIKMN